MSKKLYYLIGLTIMAPLALHAATSSAASSFPASERKDEYNATQSMFVQKKHFKSIINILPTGMQPIESTRPDIFYKEGLSEYNRLEIAIDRSGLSRHLKTLEGLQLFTPLASFSVAALLAYRYNFNAIRNIYDVVGLGALCGINGIIYLSLNKAKASTNSYIGQISEVRKLLNSEECWLENMMRDKNKCTLVVTGKPLKTLFIEPMQETMIQTIVHCNSDPLRRLHEELAANTAQSQQTMEAVLAKLGKLATTVNTVQENTSKYEQALSSHEKRLVNALEQLNAFKLAAQAKEGVTVPPTSKPEETPASKVEGDKAE